MSNYASPHNFYIPVMGTGFTIDTPLAVAKYGVSSVIALLDDVLIEQMRKFWCEKAGEPYEAVSSKDEDRRAKRITLYLNLLKRLVDKQISSLKASPFAPDSDITKYCEMLPDGPFKASYQKMLVENDNVIKLQLQQELRNQIVAGSIDVNIMTKLDLPHFRDGQMLPYEFCDAAAALRGYAKSDLCSTVVFSAGFNPHLYGYAAKFNDFLPDETGQIKKKICLKVSDYRSAAVQGKYLAKHGLWVSEYRIESALNCGGHAFINDGQLMGPILEEFKQRKDELIETLYEIYKNALKSIKKFCSDVPQKVRLTAQGGIGTYEEHTFLIDHYKLDGAGWGTPFLLVPEVTNVDSEQLKKLIAAKANDVFLSPSSPLGVPFWNLMTSASEEARRERIKQGIPGSVCVKGYSKLNQEFTEKAICVASREYQKCKLQQLEENRLTAEQYAAAKEVVLSKSCICHDLSGGATLKYSIDKHATPAICPGPNIVNFNKIATLKEMIGHIYGRFSLLVNADRPHMFIREIQLQMDYLFNEIKKASQGFPKRSHQKLCEVKENLSQGLEYYQLIAKEVFKEKQEKFVGSLHSLQEELKKFKEYLQSNE